MLMGVRVPRIMATAAVVAILGGCALHDPYPVDLDPGGCHPPPVVHVLAAGKSTRLRPGKTLQLTVPAHTRIRIKASGDCSDSVRLNSPSAEPSASTGSSPAAAHITTLYVLWVPCKTHGNGPSAGCPLIEFAQIETHYT
jgi:hypothetical protein